MTKVKKELKRSFGGKISGFKNRGESNMEKKHLRAYLKGHKTFVDSFMTNSVGMRVPREYPVLEIWS